MQDLYNIQFSRSELETEIRMSLRGAYDEAVTELLTGHYFQMNVFVVHDVAREIAAQCIKNDVYTKIAGMFLNHLLNSRVMVCGAFSEAYPTHVLTAELLDFIQRHALALNAMIDHSDESYDYTAMLTFIGTYLMCTDQKIHENIQFLFLRVACALHMPDLSQINACYQRMRRNFYTHASPTLFNAGTVKGTLSSCFLLTVPEDSIDGISELFRRCAKISAASGGIGMAFTQIRSSNSEIRGSPGARTGGLIRPIRVFNECIPYFNQGGKRSGAMAIYLEPWHADVEQFLKCKAPFTDHDSAARNLFYGLMINDIFMTRVERNQDWTLFNPMYVPDLVHLYGESFTNAYDAYERKGTGTKTIKARFLWNMILESLQESGTPYILYKDHINRKNAQSNLGTIYTSNLCAEIVQYTSPSEIACCNLASICLPACVASDGTFDFKLLHSLARELTLNLNNVIDRTKYPLHETKQSNMRHRPIAIGVQGLADVFHELEMAYESDEAALLNKQIFEVIYHGALTESNQLAKINGKTYDSYEDSHAQQGLLQQDLWDMYHGSDGIQGSADWLDWDALREDIRAHGLYNSLLTACMPTVSTSKIFGSTDGCEPVQALLYVQKTQHGETIIINNRLIKKLKKYNVWTSETMNAIIRERGSIQNIQSIPGHLKNIFKTVWEMSVKRLIFMSASRGRFIDQTQSFNVYTSTFDRNRVTSILFEGFRRGLKTGCYYFRTQAAAHAESLLLEPTCTACVV